MAYRTFTANMEALEKRINAIGRECDKYGLQWHYERIRQYPEKIKVYHIDHDVRHFHHEEIISVTEYDFMMEDLKLGNYEVMAIIEHEEKANVVYQLRDDITLDRKYWTIDGICEHCNVNRYRKNTALLQDENGNIKQVGFSCLKEYTGIDDISILSVYRDIHDIDIDPTRDGITDTEYSAMGNEHYFETEKFITIANELINKNGYLKVEERNSTKIQVSEAYNEAIKISDEARKIIDYFRNTQFDDSFNNNIQTILLSDYISFKHSGIACYSPVAYHRELQRIEDEKKKNAEKAISNYVGNIGDKIQLTLTYVKHFSYEVQYGYRPTINHIHIFKDGNGNVYKWNTDKVLFFITDNDGHEKYNYFNLNDKVTIKGTIKEHTEYNGEKQTVLTRCKVISEKPL